MKLNSMIREIDKICPFSLQETWDHSGLQVGDGEAEIRKILVAFDFTEEILTEAIAGEFDLIITHHPFFFRPLSYIDLQTAKGRMVAGLIEHKIALVACHTNLDKIGEFGVNAVLGEALGLTSCQPFIAEETGVGFGMKGILPEPLSFGTFADRVKAKLNLDSLRTVGNPADMVVNVIVMGGSGAEFMAEAKKQGADVYVSADFRYHDGQTAKEMGLKLIDGSHFGTEALVVEGFARKLSAVSDGVTVAVAAGIEDYWQYR